ncbi:hypothetical protein [Enterocloster lavalensis]|uniref:hypothetical protein n=1 Tax=Enterocloster lavalensis TaxID=460384 RepID=UPI001DB2882A|nr:hypothetical protein [Enterocloster lavalensis]MBS5606156.1 hypothetical protein [Enterocloster asparagiformis]
MALYVAADGTIHNRNDTEVRRGAQERRSARQVSTSRIEAYWFVTIALAILIGCVLYATVGKMIFDVGPEPEGLGEGICSFFGVIAPFAAVAGAVTGAILYGVSYAADSSYNLNTYILASLSALAGAVAAGLILMMICFLIVVFVYMVGAMLVCSLIFGIFLGGS